MASVAGRAQDGIRPGAGPALAGIGLRARVSVVAPRSVGGGRVRAHTCGRVARARNVTGIAGGTDHRCPAAAGPALARVARRARVAIAARSEEHTSELQSPV